MGIQMLLKFAIDIGCDGHLLPQLCNLYLHMLWLQRVSVCCINRATQIISVSWCYQNLWTPKVITEGTSSCWGTLRAQMRMGDSHNQRTNNLLIIHASILYSNPTLWYVRQIPHGKMIVYLLTGVSLNVTIHWSQMFHLQDGPTCVLQCTPTVGRLWAVCANLNKFKGASRVGHFHRPSSHNCNRGSKLWPSLLNGLTIDYTGVIIDW